MRTLPRVFILCGLGISVYLFQSYLAITKGITNGNIDICADIFGKGCSNALNSEYSLWLKFPLAGWSILFYSILFLLSIIPALFGQSFKMIATVSTLLLSFVSVIVAVALVGLMVLDKSLLCPLCCVLHIVNITLFILFFTYDGKKLIFKLSSEFSTRFAISNLFRKIFNKWFLSAFFSFILSIFSIFWLLNTAVRKSQRTSTFIDLGPVISNYEQQPVQKISVDSMDAQTGNGNSFVKVVLFSDFFCPGCRILAEEIIEIQTRYKDSCSIVFKHFPLSTECNPSLQNNLHPLACNAAFAAEAARQAGKFWEFHDSLFSYTGPRADGSLLRSIAIRAGVSVPLYDQFVISKQTSDAVQRNISEGNRLKLEGTPAVFLNGKRIEKLQKGILSLLIDIELEKIRSSFKTKR